MTTPTYILNELMLMENEKGALSHATTGDPRVDLFYKTVRGLSKKRLRTYLEASWRKDPLETLKIIFFIRDTRGKGKGEKKLFYDAYEWLIEKHLPSAQENIINIPFYGYFKDWLICFCETELESYMVDRLAEQLSEDWRTIEEGGKELSLAWKWTPSEKSSFDRKYGLVNKLCKRMKISKKEYRHRCGIVRAALNVVEQLMCGREWESIVFENVSSVAMHRYKKSFSKHCALRWSEYLQNVQTGETKMNVSQLMPNDIVSQYTWNGFTRNDAEAVEAVEAQWVAYKRYIEKSVEWKDNVLVVLDVSGSMFGREGGSPINVGVALTLTAAHLCKGKFHNKFIPFSRIARFVKIPESSLFNQCLAIFKANEVANTNFQAVFECILDAYDLWDVPEEEEITKLLVITDGQWDQMTDDSSKTHFEAALDKFSKADRKFPSILYWNVASRTIDFPTSASQPNTCLMSGYSADLMKLIVDGEDVDPLSMVLKSISDPRYDRIEYVDYK